MDRITYRRVSRFHWEAHAEADGYWYVGWGRTSKRAVARLFAKLREDGHCD